MQFIIYLLGGKKFLFLESVAAKCQTMANAFRVKVNNDKNGKQYVH